MILCTPYENPEKSDGWKIAVCRHNGILYLYDFNVAEKKFDTPTLYHGRKFEKYLTADAVDSLPDRNAPVNTKEAFLSIVRACLATRHTIVLSAEVDCCDKDNHHEYIELKTTKGMEPSHHSYTMLRWWAQCVLNGTEKIVCGFKDPNGIVRELRSYRTSDLPGSCKKLLPDCWKPKVCWNFLDQFLQHVKDTVKQDYNEAIYVFSFIPKSDPDNVTCEVESPPGLQYLFLPAWFTGDPTNSRPNTSHHCDEKRSP
jgi:RAT1-interacting protein